MPEKQYRKNISPTDEKNAYRKAMGRGTRYRIVGSDPGLLICAVFLIAVIAACTAVIVHRSTAPEPPAPGETVGGALDSSDTDTAVPDDVVNSVTVIAENIHTGELILVNSEHEYVFPDTDTDVSVYDNKTSAYKVNDLSVTLSMDAIVPFNRLMDDFFAESGCRDVMVVSGYRTAEFQRELYSERVASEGVEAAAKYVALPGQSEHHTGLAMDLSVYTSSGEGYYVRDYKKCTWLVENFENYGFILRYPEEKAELTGISYESWHYRYVGLPHSVIMKEFDMCLEEYITYLHTLTDGAVLEYLSGTATEKKLSQTDDNAYVIWYVPQTGDKTEIVLPSDRDYSISGDNVSGFIVTLSPKNGN